MKADTRTTADQVRTYCARIGLDPMLVQGAGGNVSWKDGDVLWVKASGTWLADASNKDIFTPVDLPHLQRAIASRDFSVPVPRDGYLLGLRPSIETLLHALLPHKVVVHLHPIEILAHMVRANPEKELQRTLGSTHIWSLVNYYKPGAALAGAVADQLNEQPKLNVIFLRNHGVVIGGNKIEEIEDILNDLTSKLTNVRYRANHGTLEAETEPAIISWKYARSKDNEINQLAIDSMLASRVKRDWALYPDHVVFLGKQAFIYQGASHFLETVKDKLTPPPFLFILGNGVYENQSATQAQRAQLRCYYDVIIRQSADDRLCCLDEEQISDLINWDAEKYRLQGHTTTGQNG
jgi:rhamnose utilization protein RhaD (predicted bifunctional aldolase and dehydrogenase)